MEAGVEACDSDGSTYLRIGMVMSCRKSIVEPLHCPGTQENDCEAHVTVDNWIDGLLASVSVGECGAGRSGR